MHFKNYLSLLFLLLVMLLSEKAVSQERITKKVCGTNFPEQNTRETLGKRQGPKYDVTNQEYHLIPVVVHIIHEGGDDSVSKSLVHSQIKVLNEHFGKYGAGENDHPDGSDTKIRLCLANKNPQGKASDGINYIRDTNATTTKENDLRIKNLSRWPTKRYLNIWVVKKIKSDLGDSLSIGAYATLPEKGAGSKRDGIVIDADVFGIHGDPNNQGKSATHEVGHYLNLRHPWGTKPQSGCQDDDFVDDTPLCRGPFFSKDPDNPCKPKPRHECFGINRMTANYMEFSIDPCQNIFTQGQKKRMRKAIAEYRSPLVTFSNVYAAGCGDMYDSLNNQPNINQKLYPNARIFPNPAEDFLYASILAKEDRTLTLTFYNLSGQRVKTVKKTGLKTNRIKIYVGELSPGMYILKSEFGDQSRRKKILITEKGGL